MTIDGITQVQARIAAIRSLGGMPPAMTTTSVAATTATAATTSTAASSLFDSALASALGTDESQELPWTPSLSPSPAPTSAVPGTYRMKGDSPYTEEFKAAGARYGVDPAVLEAVARAESGFKPGARSGAGAQGLMQLMPATARELGVDPLNPTQAIDGAARLLAGQMNRFGSLDLALAAYNAGGGAVKKYGGIPPFKETQNYVRKIKGYLGTPQ